MTIKQYEANCAGCPNEKRCHDDCVVCEKMGEGELTLTLNSPLTEEEWDILNDFDFERTDRIWFHTKHGKTVEFIKKETDNG